MKLLTMILLKMIIFTLILPTTFLSHNDNVHNLFTTIILPDIMCGRWGVERKRKNREKPLHAHKKHFLSSSK
uniref:Uncharacterized protein n=1 Tax=Lepeophtheirus salmonis TaxID=72036 RepID=A0A0K2VAA4_LEPSM